MEDALISIDVRKEIFSSTGSMMLEIRADLQPGELVTLYGPSGAGKTTLLRMISGLVKPDSGTIRFGEEIWFDAKAKIDLPPQNRKTGFMFQDYALFPNMTVRENILYAQPKKDTKKADELLESFGLTDLSGRKPSKLSGGQKQRVALLRALSTEPGLLLLDEPLSALDASLRSSLQEEILKVHKASKAITLMVSHDLGEVFRMSDKVICIDHGTVTGSGRPMDLFSNSQISGKVQITGQIVHIQPQDVCFKVTLVTGINQIITVIAFEDDMKKLHIGDRVMIYTKAFNPMIQKIA